MAFTQLNGDTQTFIPLTVKEKSQVSHWLLETEDNIELYLYRVLSICTCILMIKFNL